MAEKFWLDETDPAELRRRASDLRRDGLHAAAQQLLDRAEVLETVETEVPTYEQVS